MKEKNGNVVSFKFMICNPGRIYISGKTKVLKKF